MFTPYHNAHPFQPKGYYYLVNGNWDGGWEGVPNNVTMFNWYSPDDKTVKFFADRGTPQILCGFYDATAVSQMKQNISTWMKVTKGYPLIFGFMYTTWQHNYAQLDEYFKLVDTYDTWSKE